MKDLGAALLWKGGDQYGPQHVSTDQLHLDSERHDLSDDTDYIDTHEASHQGVLHIGGEGDTEPTGISHAFPAYEEEELSYTD